MSRSSTAVRSVGAAPRAPGAAAPRGRAFELGKGLGRGGEPASARRIHVAVDGLALLADAAVVIDAQVAADADEPRLEVRAPIEGVQRLEDLEEDVLRQVLGLVVLAGELVGDVEDLAPVLADDLAPTRPGRPRGSAGSARRWRPW
jgi:hypothetical protein